MFTEVPMLIFSKHTEVSWLFIMYVITCAWHPRYIKHLMSPPIMAYRACPKLTQSEELCHRGWKLMPAPQPNHVSAQTANLLTLDNIALICVRAVITISMHFLPIVMLQGQLEKCMLLRNCWALCNNELWLPALCEDFQWFWEFIWVGYIELIHPEAILSVQKLRE